MTVILIHNEIQQQRQLESKEGGCHGDRLMKGNGLGSVGVIGPLYQKCVG